MRHLLLILFAVPCFASGPKYRQADAKLDDEIRTIYHAIDSVTKGDVRISSVSVSTLSVTVIKSPSLTTWISYTPNVSNTTSIAIRQGFWRRIGDSMELRVGVAWNGAGSGADFTVELPTGYTIDTAKLPSNSILSLGTGQWADASTSRKIVAVRYNSTTVVSFDVSGGTSLIPGTDFADGDSLTFQILIPISGWTF